MTRRSAPIARWESPWRTSGPRPSLMSTLSNGRLYNFDLYLLRREKPRRSWTSSYTSRLPPYFRGPADIVNATGRERVDDGDHMPRGRPVSRVQARLRATSRQDGWLAHALSLGSHLNQSPRQRD